MDIWKFPDVHDSRGTLPHAGPAMGRSVTAFHLVEDVAAKLRVPPEVVQSLIRDGLLPAIVIPPDIVRIAPAISVASCVAIPSRGRAGAGAGGTRASPGVLKPSAAAGRRPTRDQPIDRRTRLRRRRGQPRRRAQQERDRARPNYHSLRTRARDRPRSGRARRPFARTRRPPSTRCSRRTPRAAGPRWCARRQAPARRWWSRRHRPGPRADPGQRALILAHREELIAQAAATVRAGRAARSASRWRTRSTTAERRGGG